MHVLRGVLASFSWLGKFQHACYIATTHTQYILLFKFFLNLGRQGSSPAYAPASCHFATRLHHDGGMIACDTHMVWIACFDDNLLSYEFSAFFGARSRALLRPFFLLLNTIQRFTSPQLRFFLHDQLGRWIGDQTSAAMTSSLLPQPWSPNTNAAREPK